MSAPTGKIKLTKEMRNQMAKPRMTKSEKAIVKAINAVVFATPEIRNGQKFLDRTAFNKLPDQTQKIYLDLVIHKTF